MKKITGIHTLGYRGPVTSGQFLPPGEYSVGTVMDIANSQVSRQAAEYMVGIDKAWITSEILEISEDDKRIPVIEAALTNEDIAGIEKTLENQPRDSELTLAEDEPVSYTPPTIPPRAELEAMTLPNLRALAEMINVNYPSNIRKPALVELLAVD